MAKDNKANSKSQGKSMTGAAKKSTKSGAKITRDNTTDRREVRQNTTHRQGHTK